MWKRRWKIPRKQQYTRKASTKTSKKWKSQTNNETSTIMRAWLTATCLTNLRLNLAVIIFCILRKECWRGNDTPFNNNRAWCLSFVSVLCLYQLCWDLNRIWDTTFLCHRLVYILCFLLILYITLPTPLMPTNANETPHTDRTDNATSRDMHNTTSPCCEENNRTRAYVVMKERRSRRRLGGAMPGWWPPGYWYLFTYLIYFIWNPALDEMVLMVVRYDYDGPSSWIWYTHSLDHQYNWCRISLHSPWSRYISTKYRTEKICHLQLTH